MPVSDEPTLPPAEPPREPSRIGPYWLLERLGIGGMGEVWKAEQKEPIRRFVALKIIKRGMDTDTILARFATERQALALMDHPCIGKVFDAGVTQDGRPYFVMEYFPGVPITTYCDRERLNVAARLQLFRLICGAVEHAHQKAIIHRDLSPSNILVASRDGEARPTIIDFGLAKVIGQPLVERPPVSDPGQFVGTITYASPEQVAGSADLDTRTDVYSLGAVLYELLTGLPPFDLSGGLEAAKRRIVSDDPPAPSARLKSIATNLSQQLARSRGTDSRSLARQLAGDLDAILLAALRKDRSQRYSAPRSLENDLGRYLDGLPVSPRRQSIPYVAGRFVRRHPLGVPMTILAVFGLLGLVGVVMLEEQRLARQTENRIRSQDLLGWLNDITLKLRRDRGDEDARSYLRRILESARSALGEDDLLTIAIKHNLATACEDSACFPEAESLLRDVISRRSRLLGISDSTTFAARYNLADKYLWNNRLGDAEKEMKQLLQDTRDTVPELDRLRLRHNLARTYFMQERYEEAASLLRQVIEQLKSTVGATHTETQEALVDLSCSLVHVGDFNGAILSLREAVENGFRKSEALRTDPDLAPLRSRPDFESILATAERQ